MSDQEKDDDYAIDWEETAYTLPPDHLMSGDCFRELGISASNYKDYFDSVRESHGLPPMNLNNLAASVGKKERGRSENIKKPVKESTLHRVLETTKYLHNIKETLVRPMSEYSPATENKKILIDNEKKLPSPALQIKSDLHDSKQMFTVTESKRNLNDNEQIMTQPVTEIRNNSSDSKEILNSPTLQINTNPHANKEILTAPMSKSNPNEISKHIMSPPAPMNNSNSNEISKQVMLPSAPASNNKSMYNNKEMFGKNPVTNDNCTIYHLLTKETKEKSSIHINDRLFYHEMIHYKDESNRPDEEKRRWQLLTTMIVNEQKKYQQFLHSAALANMYEYLYLDNLIQEQLLNVTYKSVCKLIEEKKKFKMLSQVTWKQLLPPKSDGLTFLTFKQQVYKEGVIPKFELPPVGKVLPFDKTVITETWKKKCLSEDIIETICKTEKADIYMHSEAFLSIMETLAVDSRESLLSVEIKEFKTGDECKKVLLFKKPLPRRIVSTREVNDNYYGNLLKRLVKQNDYSSDHVISELPEVPGEEIIIDVGDKKVPTNSYDKTNIHINLFELGDFRILLETTIDQCNQESKTFQISPKCEYQYVIGCEQFSVLELCRAFWDSHIANTDWIVFSRVDPRNNVIRRNDTYTRNVLCPPACPYSPSYYCNHLHHFLKELKSFSTGQYVLERSANEPCFKIFQETNSEGFTLETAYQDILYKKQFIVDLALPWLPIDTAIMTDILEKNCFIPALFEQFQKWKNKTKKGKGGNNIPTSFESIQSFKNKKGNKGKNKRKNKNKLNNNNRSNNNSNKNKNSNNNNNNL